MTQMPFLLVPGLNCTDKVFAGLVPALWPIGPVMLANHQRGKDIAETAAAILADAPARFVLIGFSFGGYLAFEMLRQGGGRIGKLALLDTSARPDSPEQSDKRRAGIARTEAGDYQGAVEASFPAAVHPDHAGRADLLALHMGMARDAGPEVYVRQQRAILERPDSRPDLSRIHVPTLVLVGEGDQITPPEVAREMATGIAGAQLVVVPGAGHLALLEQPQAVNAAVLGWARA